MTENVAAQLYSSGNNTISGNKVGIGTMSPNSSLSIKAQSYLQCLPNTFCTPPSSYQKVNPFRVEYYHNPGPPAGPIVNPEHRTAIFVKWDGLIGIHTSNPLEGFHINTTIRGGDLNGSLRLQTDDGYVRIGAVSSSYMHFETDLPNFHFNKGIQVDGSILIYDPSGLGSGDNQILLKSDGSIRAREVKVDLDVIPDYVFDEDYDLMPLEEVKWFIEKNKHLPNVKSAAEFEIDGSISLTEMNLKLLEKVEELTLYILQLEERIKVVELEGGRK